MFKVHAACAFLCSSYNYIHDISTLKTFWWRGESVLVVPFSVLRSV